MSSSAFRMLNCPFCDSEIAHIESWARSFNPPRLYHEWHHPDPVDGCHLFPGGGNVAFATDDPEMQVRTVRRWNTRAAPPSPDREAGFVKPDNDGQVFFYEQDFYVLSNFSAFNVIWRGVRFQTSEHAYHFERFWGASPQVTAEMARDFICNTTSAHEAFRYAQDNKGWQRRDWNEVKVDAMRGILRAKADQHEYVRRKLLATGDRELIEDSWRDDFWGWGPNRDGKNMLGKLWMDVRAELRSAPPSNAGEGGK